MKCSPLPEKIYVITEKTEEVLKRGKFTIPKNMAYLSEAGTKILYIWTQKKVKCTFLNEQYSNLDIEWAEFRRDDFIFNLLMFSDKYKYFVVNPLFYKNDSGYFDTELIPYYDGNIFPTDLPMIFRALIVKKLSEMNISKNKIEKIFTSINTFTFLRCNLYDLYKDICKMKSRKIVNKELNKDFSVIKSQKINKKTFNYKSTNIVQNHSSNKNSFYVYMYINKQTEVPFYVGKGKNYRYSAHMNEAKNSIESNPKLNEIRHLNFEEGIEIIIVENNLDESHALALEVKLIREIGRIDLGEGPLLNRSNGGEGISGGVDQYGYKRTGIARFITDLVHRGELIQNMPSLVREYVEKNNMNVKWVEERIIPHIQEMGNVGCHYKGPKILLQGWQFSLNGKMVDVNSLTLQKKGFLKVHGDLPFNEGYVA